GDELRQDVQSVRLDVMATLRRPHRCAFHQVAASAPDIEKRAVAIDRGEYEAARLLPLRWRARRAGLAARVSRGEVGLADDVADLSMPLRLVDVAALVGCVE